MKFDRRDKARLAALADQNLAAAVESFRRFDDESKALFIFGIMAEDHRESLMDLIAEGYAEWIGKLCMLAIQQILAATDRADGMNGEVSDDVR